MIDNDIEPEQFVEEQNDTPSKEVYKKLREEKRFEALKVTNNIKEKHKAKLKKNLYICDNCGNSFKKEEGSLIYKTTGEYAYCLECLKVLYPNYKKVRLATLSKLDTLNDGWDRYFSRLH